MTNLLKLQYEQQRRRERRDLKLKALGVVMIFIVAFAISVLTPHAEEPKIIYGNGLLEKLNAGTTEVGISPEETKEASTEINTHEYSSITISDEEYIELCQIVAAEAQTQCLEGQKAVVEVIFNRVLSPYFPNSVHGVLSQKGQFATWRMRNAKWVQPQLATEAIAAVVANGRTVLPDTSYVYFDTKGINGRRHIKIQDHWFGAR